MESNADQQPEENKDIPNNNTELNKVREKREKVCIPFIYLISDTKTNLSYHFIFII
jgi:hypothetical protein